MEFAQALGYGRKDDFTGFYEQLDKIADQTGGGGSGTGFFDKIRAALRAFAGSDETN